MGWAARAIRCARGAGILPYTLLWRWLWDGFGFEGFGVSDKTSYFPRSSPPHGYNRYGCQLCRFSDFRSKKTSPQHSNGCWVLSGTSGNPRRVVEGAERGVESSRQDSASAGFSRRARGKALTFQACREVFCGGGGAGGCVPERPKNPKPQTSNLQARRHGAHEPTSPGSSLENSISGLQRPTPQVGFELISNSPPRPSRAAGR